MQEYFNIIGGNLIQCQIKFMLQPYILDEKTLNSSINYMYIFETVILVTNECILGTTTFGNN